MVLDPIPQSLPVQFFGSRPQPPTSPSIPLLDRGFCCKDTILSVSFAKEARPPKSNPQKRPIQNKQRPIKETRKKDPRNTLEIRTYVHHKRDIRSSRETHKRNFQKRSAEETRKRGPQKRHMYIIQETYVHHKTPTNETQKRPAKETRKRDPQKRYTYIS